MPDLVFITDEPLNIDECNAVGITSSLISNRVRMAVFNLVSGGDIYHTIGTPSADGSGGEIEQTANDHWEIWGWENVKDWKGIGVACGTAAVVSVQLWGSGS